MFAAWKSPVVALNATGRPRARERLVHDRVEVELLNRPALAAA